MTSNKKSRAGKEREKKAAFGLSPGFFLAAMLVMGLAYLSFVGCQPSPSPRDEPAKRRQPRSAKRRDKEPRAEAAPPRPDLSAIVARQRILPRPLVFIETQGTGKYGLYDNYLHFWIDRPLLFDRSTRSKPGKAYKLTYPSVKKINASVAPYGIDGLALYLTTTGSREGFYATYVDYINKTNLKDFGFVPLNFGKRKNMEGADFKCPGLEKALASPHAKRIDGKVLVLSYAANRTKPEKWTELLGKLRKKYGDTFLFMAAVGLGPLSPGKYPKMYYENGERMPAAELEKLKEHLRSYLDVCDGILMERGARTLDGGLDAHFQEKFALPLYAGILAESKYRKKLLGARFQLGYVNHFTASRTDEDGTRCLRQTLEGGIRASADVFLGFEWDEANENTGLQPTVYRSFSSQRILKYYMHRLKHEPLTPNPGDDLTIPNLIISYRRIYKLGDEMRIELLNVPDSLENKNYRVRLSLKDPDGNVVKSFPEETFAGRDLRDKTFSIPTESLAAYPVLRPSLEVTNPAGKKFVFEDGLHPIRIHATWNRNYMFVKQPLRDLLQPQSASFTVSSQPGGKSVRIQGAIVCGEPLASLEVLENGDEIYAVDRNDEYPSRDTHTVISVNFTIMRSKRLQGTLTVKNSPFKFHAARKMHGKQKREGNTVKIDCPWFMDRDGAGFFVVLPRKTAAEAVLDFDFKLPQRGEKPDEVMVFKTSVPVKRILASGTYGQTYDEGFYVVFEDYRKLPDIPVHIDRNEASFDFAFTPESDGSVFHLRAITKLGKTYRSAPVRVRRPGGEKVRLNVYSQTKKDIVTVEVASYRIPDLDYDFTPKYGTVFRTAAGRSWFGRIGGGSEYGQPFNRPGNYPKEAKVTAPRWVTEDGAACLKFDGQGNFIVLPHGIVPQGPFTLSCEIKPTSDKPQLLFISYGIYPGPFTLWLKDGKLQGRYLGKLIPKDKGPYFKDIHLDSGLPVAVGAWSRVEVSYDLRNFVFKVNGKASQPLPFSREGFAFSPGVFGGYSRTPMGKIEGFAGFAGYLRSFRVRHNVQR